VTPGRGFEKVPNWLRKTLHDWIVGEKNPLLADDHRRKTTRVIQKGEGRLSVKIIPLKPTAVKW